MRKPIQRKPIQRYRRVRRPLPARVLIAACVALVAAGVGAPAHADPPAPPAITPFYPDLRTLPPTALRLSQVTVNGVIHHEVRFSTWFANVGQGPLELHGTPHVPLDGQFDATQHVYGPPTGVRQFPVGTFAYHPEHSHFHLDDFTRFELWRRRDFERAMERGFTRGEPLAVRDKVSFCLYDSQRIDMSPTVAPLGVYKTCTPLMEGISVGWADLYDWGMASQSVVVGPEPLEDGHYVIRNVADPANRIWESDGKADPARESEMANQGYRHFSIVNGALVVGA